MNTPRNLSTSSYGRPVGEGKEEKKEGKKERKKERKNLLLTITITIIKSQRKSPHHPSPSRSHIRSTYIQPPELRHETRYMYHHNLGLDPIKSPLPCITVDDIDALRIEIETVLAVSVETREDEDLNWGSAVRGFKGYSTGIGACVKEAGTAAAAPFYEAGEGGDLEAKRLACGIIGWGLELDVISIWDCVWRF